MFRLRLKNIPKQSLPTDYKPVILNTTEITTTPIPGLQVLVLQCHILLSLVVIAIEDKDDYRLHSVQRHIKKI